MIDDSYDHMRGTEYEIFNQADAHSFEDSQRFKFHSEVGHDDRDFPNEQSLVSQAFSSSKGPATSVRGSLFPQSATNPSSS